MAQTVHARLSPREGRKFALTVGAAFLVLAGLAWWRGKHATAAVLGSLGILLSVAGLVIPTRLGPVQRGWMGIAHAISKVTTPIVLAVIYFGVIAPAGFVMRLFGRKTLERKADTTTYWVTRERTRAPDQMQHQF